VRFLGIPQGILNDSLNVLLVDAFPIPAKQARLQLFWPWNNGYQLIYGISNTLQPQHGDGSDLARRSDISLQSALSSLLHIPRGICQSFNRGR
jgi:hypothetical protein